MQEGVEIQEWFWTPEWQAAEKEAEADIEAGRVYEFGSVDEALGALKLGTYAVIGDEPDPMTGDYSEVLHEDRLP